MYRVTDEYAKNYGVTTPEQKALLESDVTLLAAGAYGEGYVKGYKKATKDFLVGALMGGVCLGVGYGLMKVSDKKDKIKQPKDLK